MHRLGVRGRRVVRDKEHVVFQPPHVVYAQRPVRFGRRWKHVFRLAGRGQLVQLAAGIAQDNLLALGGPACCRDAVERQPRVPLPSAHVEQVRRVPEDGGAELTALGGVRHHVAHRRCGIAGRRNLDWVRCASDECWQVPDQERTIGQRSHKARLAVRHGQELHRSAVRTAGVHGAQRFSLWSRVPGAIVECITKRVQGIEGKTCSVSRAPRPLGAYPALSPQPRRSACRRRKRDWTRCPTRLPAAGRRAAPSHRAPLGAGAGTVVRQLRPARACTKTYRRWRLASFRSGDAHCLPRRSSTSSRRHDAAAGDFSMTKRLTWRRRRY